MINVVTYSTIIRPGGGPGGYVYNLMSATRGAPTKNRFLFCGHKFYDRSANKPDNWPLALKAQIYLSARGIYLPFFSDILELRSLAQGAVVVFHGPVHPRLVYKIKSVAAKIVFMPHSPSVWCDEYMMTYASAGRRISKRRFDYFKWAEHVSIAYADYLVFPSRNAAFAYREVYADQLRMGKDVYIASGVHCDVDAAAVERSYGRLNGRNVLTIGFIGRYNSHKGYDQFCRAAENLSSARVRFVSFGEGPINSLSKKVENKGWVNDISRAILDCDIIVVPNKVCYYDLLPLEAACHGRPMVFTPVGGNLDQAKSFPDSVLADSMELDALIMAIKDAIVKKMENHRWGIENRIKYNAFYTDKAMLNRWDDFVSSIL